LFEAVSVAGAPPPGTAVSSSTVLLVSPEATKATRSSTQRTVVACAKMRNWNLEA